MSRPLRPNVTSSIKLEVHNVAQRRRRKTEPRPQWIHTQNFVLIGPAVPEICLRTDRQAHRQTNTQADGLITILRTSTAAEYITRNPATTDSWNGSSSVVVPLDTINVDRNKCRPELVLRSSFYPKSSHLMHARPIQTGGQTDEHHCNIATTFEHILR